MKGKIFITLIILLAIIPIYVSAESQTGTLSIDAATGNSWTGNFGGSGRATDFEYFHFYSSGYNHISKLEYTGSTNWVFPKDFDSTTFTIISGGSGYGYVTYNKTSRKVIWYFYDATITGNFRVSYDVNIWTGITAGLVDGAPALSTTKPIFLSTTGWAQRLDGSSVYTTSTIVQTSKSFSNNYQVTYLDDDLTQVFIDKSVAGSVSSKIFLLRLNDSVYTSEPSFNTNNLSVIIDKNYGLKIKMTDSVGNYDVVTVNTTGAPTPTPTATPPSIPTGELGALAFNKTNYTLGENGLIITNVDTGLLDIFSTYRVDFYSNTIPLISQFEIDTSQDSQYFPVSFSSPGMYTAILVKSTPILGDSIKATATTNVVVGVSSISINNTVPYHTQVPVAYSFGVSGINLNYGIQTYYLNPTSGSYEFEHSFFGLSQNGTKNVYFEKIGTYNIKLKNVPQNIVYAQAYTQTTFIAPQIQVNITDTTLSITKASYYYGDTIFGNYTINDTVWVSGELYLSVYNYDKSLTTAIMQGSGIGWTDISMKQQGDLLVELLNVPESENFQETNFISGNNALRLMIRYSSNGTDGILAYQNFTLTDETATGYGLRLSKYSVYEKEKFFAYAIVPESAKLILVNTGTNSTKGTLLANIGVNQSPATIPISISKEGNYAIILNNPSGDTEIMQNVEVKKLQVTPTETPIPSPNQIGNDILALLQSTTFWGLVFIVGIMLTVAVYERKGK